ncbi:unnamed protein product, partial [Medioppia subpectinata]
MRRYSREFKCFLGGNCVITADNRKHCKRCRLDKCLAAGMKPHLIYCRKLKWDLKYLNDIQVVEGSSTSGEDLLPFDFTDKQYIDTNVDNICDMSGHISGQQLVAIDRPITDYNTVFNELEGNRFTELLNATKTPENTGNPRDETLVDEMTDGLLVLALKHENWIKETVEMCQLLASFGDLCENDRLILIKYSSIKINVLRMVSSFNYQAIFLFNPNRPHLTHKTTIKHQQNLHDKILEHCIGHWPKHTTPLFTEICNRYE